MSLIQDMKKHKNLTEREQDIRQYILEHPEKIEEMSSRELGHATFASAASVTRFCQKLGTKGFPEFKLQLVRELQYETIEEEEVITMSERENVVTMVRKATQVQKQAIKETKKELSYSQLVKIGRMIADASCVDFYVYDMNVYLADYGCSLFFHAGKVANVHSATNIQGLHAAMPADGHVAILISHTGKNERLAEIAGMPRSIVNRANDILKQLEQDNAGVGGAGKPNVQHLDEHKEGVQLSFFQLDDPVLSQIRDEILGLDVNNLTPVEALNKLNDIKKILLGR